MGLHQISRAVLVGMALSLTVCVAAARPVSRAAGLPPYEQAARDRQVLEAGESKQKADFTRVLEEFRAIYHDNPADAHAPDAVYAVADLLAEQGRTLHDARSSRAAVGQYEFLRTQYPSSSLRTRALLQEGLLEEELGDPAAARTRYLDAVREAPHSKVAAEARERLEALSGSGQPATGQLGAGSAVRNAQADDAEFRVPAVAKAETPPVRKGTAIVSGIRHWSTATYTRVAIDLGDEVTFEAARVAHPDRIYFDLHGAKLAGELVGKSFDVTDDGFLTKIRAAQYGEETTRVVLDVNDVSEYSAFLLPNPYRLIIDIHGGRKIVAAATPTSVPVEAVPVAVNAGKTASLAANISGLPATAVTDGGETVRAVAPPELASSENAGSAQPRAAAGLGAPRTSVVTRSTPARPVPNTVAVKAPQTTSEVAAVSDSATRIEATSAPTSRPIAVRAPATTRAAPDASMPLRAARPARNAPVTQPSAEPGKAAEKTADGETSLIRALGLKVGRIVIDAGHGGHDSGTLGVDGIQEKDVVLDVALRLGKLLHDRLGAEIIYTRSDDTFIPLETRTAIANKAQADLFLSIHANSSPDPTARGVETYYLNFTSDPTALDVAARENAVSGSSVHQLSDLVKKITLKDKIDESREFAADVEGSLYSGLIKGNEGLKNRGVKKAPFVVLIGANMPSILTEISFVTNGKDAGQLREPEYRERVAESLYNGVAKYESGLAGARPAPIVRTAAR